MKKYFLLVSFLVVGALVALKFKQGSGERLSQVVENTENAVNEVATKATDTLSAAKDNATDLAERAAETAQNTVENVADKATQTTNEAVAKVQEHVAKAVDGAESKAQDLVDNAKSVAVTISDEATRVTQQVKAELVRDTSGKASKIQVPTLEFEANRAVLKDSSKDILSDVAKVIEENKSVKKVQIEGYTDTSGDPKVNKALSQKRAEAVSDYLVEVGVSKNKLIAKGFGPEKPIASNDTPEGRSANRRVEFKITQ